MKVRALVVDDSVVVRRTVANVLAEADDIDVVGTAPDGRRGLQRITELQPDVVTLDIEMPVLDGLSTLAEIRRLWPRLPVIMYSTLSEAGAKATMDALALGAVDYATKPSGANSRDAVADEVRNSLIPLVRLWGRKPAPAPRSTRVVTAPSPTEVRPVPTRTRGVDLVTIGVSTGGPDALARLVPLLPADLPVPIVVVQHMPAVFTLMLANRLNSLSAVAVSEVVDGDPALPGHVYIAAGGRHTEVRRHAGGFALTLTDAAPENSCRPAVDVLFRSAAATGARLLGVILTGMGQDGLVGAQLIHDAGGTILAQDEPTSVVWGMPGFVARAGLADRVLPLDSIAATIAATVKRPVVAGVPA